VDEIRKPPTPVMFDHCLTVYKKMAEEATDDLYEGFSTKLVQSCGLPSPYYTAVMRRLKEMGCIEQLRRGGGNAVSVWKLIRPPTEFLFDAIDLSNRRKPTRYDSVEQKVRDLNARVLEMETVINVIGRKLEQVILDNERRVQV
jgi:hypothetical protein